MRPHLPARTCFVVAHPDDEVVGAGATLTGLDEPWVVHVSTGAPKDARWWPRRDLGSPQAYAGLRRLEAARALRLAGLSADQILCLGADDQACAEQLAAIVQELISLFCTRRPPVVVTHPFEGGHPDHDATALAVRAAASAVAAAGMPHPRVYEMCSYHAGPGGLRTAAFLEPRTPELRVVLPPRETALKRAMLAAHASQDATLAQFTPGADELFRPAPRYDFSLRPHAGPLFYEQMGWSTFERWSADVSRGALGPPGRLQT